MTAEEYAMENMHDADLNEIESALIEFAKLKCQELLKIVAEKSEIKIEKKSQYGKSRKWQKVKKDEVVNLLDYEISYSVDKDSIFNAVNLDEFIK